MIVPEKKTILIVEDSPTQAEQLKYLLESYRYNVMVTQNGRKALEWLSDNKPSLVVSDIVMPEINGFDLCQRIKSDKRIEDIPVILLTSLSDPAEVIDGLSCGADSFIIKPYNKDYLISSIEKILSEKIIVENFSDKHGIEINYGGEKRLVMAGQQKSINFLLNIYQGAIQQNKELIQTRDQLRLLNESLEDLVDERTRELKKSEEKILAFNAELEERILERTAQLEAANKAKSEFLSNMSHEIRTPMNAVLGYAELLGFMIDDKIQKDYIESIKLSGRSLLTLINDILDLSKIEAGKLELQFEFVNSKSFFSEFERIFSLSMAEKGLRFILEISSETPAGIFIDDSRLRQILLNLIGNSVKFTESGSISLKVKSGNPRTIDSSNGKKEECIDLFIEVTDTGIGISKETQEEIFNPFVQGHRQNAKRYGGTGLGLAITQRLAHLMNGTIELDSRMNEGSSFKIMIPEVPYLRNFENNPEAVQLNPSDIVFEKATIIIADDVEQNRKFLIDALRKSNIEIVEAEDGQQALLLAEKIVPDLIITDIGMPVLDGFDLLERLKSNKLLKNIPVIAYSALVMKGQKDRVRESDFAGLLIKPVQINKLYHELMNILPYKLLIGDEQEKEQAEAEMESGITDLSGLIKSLRTDYNAIWETFAVRQPIDEVSEFGKSLIQLGQLHNSAVVIDYGKKLINATDSFNIEAILKLIKRYNRIIESLDSSNKNIIYG